MGGEIKISLLNVIRGFFTGEGTLKATHSKLSSEELELVDSIEIKLKKLLKSINANEMREISINDFDEGRKLVCGVVKIIEQKMFLDKVSELCHKKYKNYEEFLKDFYERKHKLIKWENIKNLNYKYNGVEYFDITTGWFNDMEKIITFIIINNDYPINMNLSNKKITMPHSDLTSLFMTTNSFHVLGITNKINNIYTLKPLALWKIMDNEECKEYIYDERFW